MSGVVTLCCHNAERAGSTHCMLPILDKMTSSNFPDHLGCYSASYLHAAWRELVGRLIPTAAPMGPLVNTAGEPDLRSSHLLGTTAPPAVATNECCCLYHPVPPFLCRPAVLSSGQVLIQSHALRHPWLECSEVQCSEVLFSYP